MNCILKWNENLSADILLNFMSGIYCAISLFLACKFLFSYLCEVPDNNKLLVLLAQFYHTCQSAV